MENNFTELEFKYSANEVKLHDFLELMQGLKEDYPFVNTLEVSSWDHYYTKGTNKEKFQRFRKSERTPELTKKIKTTEANNFERVEVDLPLHPEKVTEEIVSKFVGLDGYKENFRIFKNCFIYFFDKVNYVYYTVYDTNMKELGRYIELELNKDKVEELGDKATKVLKEHEQNLLKLGITPKNRMKKSLFEIFVR